jgi:hypothetical protein
VPQQSGFVVLESGRSPQSIRKFVNGRCDAAAGSVVCVKWYQQRSRTSRAEDANKAPISANRDMEVKYGCKVNNALKDRFRVRVKVGVGIRIRVRFRVRVRVRVRPDAAFAVVGSWALGYAGDGPHRPPRWSFGGCCAPRTHLLN